MLSARHKWSMILSFAIIIACWTSETNTIGRPRSVGYQKTWIISLFYVQLLRDLHQSIQREIAFLYYKFCACASLQKYLNRNPHTMSTAYLLLSLHSSTSTVLVNTGFPPRFHVTSRIQDMLSETTPLECRATNLVTCHFSMRFFSRLLRIAATNKQPSHTSLHFQIKKYPATLVTFHIPC